MEEINQVIKDLKSAKLNITVEGDLQTFLGVHIEEIEDGKVKFTQKRLIAQVLESLRMNGADIKVKKTPMKSSVILKRHSSSEPHDDSFHYRSVVGMLNYLEKATRSDISYATHQCARFVENPKKEHADAIRWLARYLKGTSDKGTIFKPDKSKGLEVFVDADFAGNWDKLEAPFDRDTARSRHGYIIRYAGCPILWKSQMQAQISLSTTEAEYVGLSQALKEAIPVMELLKEMKKHGFKVGDPKAKVHCKVFEDNSGAIELAKNPKYRPRTKHLNVRWHHFRDYVERGEISIHYIESENQPADYLTKPLSEEDFARLRKIIMGW